MAFCSDLVAAGTVTLGHKSVTDNNSLPSIHFSSPCASPPFIHITLSRRSVKDKKRLILFFPPELWLVFFLIWYSLQYKRVWLPQRRCVYLREVCLSSTLLDPLRTFKVKRLRRKDLSISPPSQLVSNEEESSMSQPVALWPFTVFSCTTTGWAMLSSLEC